MSPTAPAPRIRADAATVGMVVSLTYKAMSGVWGPAAIPDPYHGGPFLVTAVATGSTKTGKASRSVVRLTLRGVADPAREVELALDPSALLLPLA